MGDPDPLHWLLVVRRDALHGELQGIVFEHLVEAGQPPDWVLLVHRLQAGGTGRLARVCPAGLVLRSDNGGGGGLIPGRGERGTRTELDRRTPYCSPGPCVLYGVFGAPLEKLVSGVKHWDPRYQDSATSE